MELSHFSKLYERIQIEPSILLLGQQYLFMNGENDPVWSKLATEIYTDLHLPRRKSSYPDLWERAVTKEADAESVMARIVEASSICRYNSAIDAIMKLRWSLLYSSSIDCTDVIASSRGSSPVPFDERNGKPQYLNKDRKYRIDLCGNRENPPPFLGNKKNQKTFLRQIRNKISWISNTFLRYYGVLVIDGLDTEYDWLDDEILFAELVEMPPNSVFWFGAPAELGENAEALVEDGILTVDERSFYAHLQQHMPELFENETERQPENDPSLYTPLTLKLGDKQTHTVYISRSDISDITGANLCIIDDDILAGGLRSEKGRAQRFAEFLSQDGLPNWHLFESKQNEQAFYIPRDQDALLEKSVYEALKETGVARRPIILSGPSNSGKSMMLANLALTIAKRRKHPVIFIRGDLLSGAEKRLLDFISNWFGNSDRYDGVRVEKIIVVWDGSGLKRTERDYESLQKMLFNRNVQVVGSTYAASSSCAIKLEQDLSPKEKGMLKSLLVSLGGGYIERFNAISQNRKRVEAFENSSLLYLLQAVFKYEFDAEYKSLSQILAKQFDQERIYAERETGKSLQDYVDNFFETQKRIAQDGIASSFQEKLKLILARMAVQEQTNQNTKNISNSDEQKNKLEKLKQLSDCITAMNGILAVASEFGVALPLRLLLKFLHDSVGNTYVSYNEETAKIIEILRSDTLISFVYKSHSRFGEDYYVSFRNSMEAENYICLMCDLPLEDHSKTRKDKEVDLLLDIIDSASSDAELWSVIELIRQFGPNGHGMLSEMERMRSRKDYVEYCEYWLDIANALIQRFPEDPEAVLLYAHLTREYIGLETTDHKIYFAELYSNVRTILEGVLKKMVDHRQNGTDQYARLSVELCANYQQTMRETGYNAVIHHQIKERVRAAFRRSKHQDAADIRRDFSSNYLLDILINAYLTYKESISDQDTENTELAQIVCDIDDMLNLDDLIYERKSSDLLRKVKEIYSSMNNATEKTEALQKKLSSMNSDAFLYLQARLMWQMNTENQSVLTFSADTFACPDFYSLVVCRDIPYNRLEIPQEVYDAARETAVQVVEFLNTNEDTIRKTRSERCVAMLLRAKWFIKTGCPMLAEKQQVSLTRDEWEEINRLCNQYHSYHDANLHDAFIPAYFLKGIYEWVYGSASIALDWFTQAKDNIRSDFQARTVERFVLCAEGTRVPRTFIVSVTQRENRKYTASIVRETTLIPVPADRVATRYGMGVSDPVLKHLFDGTMPKEQQQQARKDGVVRFNLIGAQIGIPTSGGHDDD